jgi:hypothetical protein
VKSPHNWTPVRKTFDIICSTPSRSFSIDRGQFFSSPHRRFAAPICSSTHPLNPNPINAPALCERQWDQDPNLWELIDLIFFFAIELIQPSATFLINWSWSCSNRPRGGGGGWDPRLQRILVAGLSSLRPVRPDTCQIRLLGNRPFVLPLLILLYF